MTPLFLDANASANVLPVAKAALLAALDVRGNPSSPHAMGRKKRLLLDEAREQVAAALGCSDKDVVFVSGATEGLRFVTDALSALARQTTRQTTGQGQAARHAESGKRQNSVAQKGKLRVWTSPLEHPAVAKNLERIEAQGDIDLVMGEVSPKGELSFANAGDVDAVLCTYAHNETGILLDVEKLCAKVSDETLVCIDASQAVARLPPLPRRVDVAVCSAHKLGGVAGCGAFFLRGRAKGLSAGWTGGGQEHQLRPGTESTALIAAMGAACSVIEATRKSSLALSSLRDELEDFVVALDPYAELDEKNVGLRVVGKEVPRLPQTSALAFYGVGPEALRMWADRCGLAVGFGSACSALAPHASTALLSLGLDEKTARSTLRLSLDLDADDALISEAKLRLEKLVQQMKSRRR